MRQLPSEVIERGKGQEGSGQHERMGEVVAEVEDGLELGEKREVGGENFREQFDRCLDGAFRPAELLALERGVSFRDLRRDDDVGDVFEVPAFQLGAVGEVEVFGEGVGGPAPCILDRAAAPDAGGAVEVEE